MKKSFMGYNKKRRTHRRLLAETGGCCIYCGKRIDEFSATIDHIIPLSRGGYNEEINIVASCLPCNYLKYTMYVRDFVGLMPYRILGMLLYKYEAKGFLQSDQDTM